MTKPLTLQQAVSHLKSGGALVYPTETFFALGCLATSENGVKAVFALKSRQPNMPLPVIIGDAGAVLSQKDIPAHELCPEQCGHLSTLIQFSKLDTNNNGFKKNNALTNNATINAGTIRAAAINTPSAFATDSLNSTTLPHDAIRNDVQASSAGKCNAFADDVLANNASIKAQIYSAESNRGDSHCADSKSAWVCAVRLMRLFWPGSLSILLPVSNTLPKALDAGSGYVAVRLSPHEGAAELARAARGALVSSSANISGHAPAKDLEHIDPQLLQKQDFRVYDALPVPAGGLPSTVLMPLPNNGVRFVREGALSKETILQHGFFIR